jgi:hypothetical protein
LKPDAARNATPRCSVNGRRGVTATMQPQSTPAGLRLAIGNPNTARCHTVRRTATASPLDIKRRRAFCRSQTAIGNLTLRDPLSPSQHSEVYALHGDLISTVTGLALTPRSRHTNLRHTTLSVVHTTLFTPRYGSHHSACTQNSATRCHHQTTLATHHLRHHSTSLTALLRTRNSAFPCVGTSLLCTRSSATGCHPS